VAVTISRCARSRARATRGSHRRDQLPRRRVRGHSGPGRQGRSACAGRGRHLARSGCRRAHAGCGAAARRRRGHATGHRRRASGVRRRAGGDRGRAYRRQDHRALRATQAGASRANRRGITARCHRHRCCGQDRHAASRGDDGGRRSRVASSRTTGRRCGSGLRRRPRRRSPPSSRGSCACCALGRRLPRLCLPRPMAHVRDGAHRRARCRHRRRLGRAWDAHLGQQPVSFGDGRAATVSRRRS